jgi:hypothetical protein
MLFSEYYGAYFACVAEILSEAVEGTLTKEKISEIAANQGLGESVLTIPANLRNGNWPLITPDCKTPVRHLPPHPTTLLQKRWLKTLLLDPRIRLFGLTDKGLEDVAPLFDPAKIIWYDRYCNGDSFEDESYIERFRQLLEAVKTNRKVQVIFDSHRGKHNNWTVIPYRLEYSSTDDKFRLLCHSGKWRNRTLNLSRISYVRLWGTFDPDDYPVPELTNESVTLEITNERNALERAMLQFSYLAKRTERIGEKAFRMTLNYRQEDETELLIKIISFGPLVKVVEPDSFSSLIRERIEKQFQYDFS